MAFPAHDDAFDRFRKKNYILSKHLSIEFYEVQKKIAGAELPFVTNMWATIRRNQKYSNATVGNKYI